MLPYSNILVTGGAGFIGVNFIHYLFAQDNFSGSVVNLDSLTYAGNPASLSKVVADYPGRYQFVQGNINDKDLLDKIFLRYKIDCVVHFAAESHVDRSISGPDEFIQTNIVGTFNLLETARRNWVNRSDVRFHHISTDEVFGSLRPEDLPFFENTPYDPRSPYSATKASSDHLVRAYFHTYNFPISISNCSNNYGPYQFPEKLLPLMIHNMRVGRPLPIYGDGRNVRDWLFVEDHASAIYKILENGQSGQTYIVGGENEWENIKLIRVLCEIVAAKMKKKPEELESLITYVSDRPGHDQRYAVNCDKIRSELGWHQAVSFEEGLVRTVDWYFSNDEWLASIQSGEYRKWIEHNYQGR